MEENLMGEIVFILKGLIIIVLCYIFLKRLTNRKRLKFKINTN